MDLKYNIWKDCRRVPLPELLDFIVDNRGKTVPTVNQNEACNVVLIATNCIRNENLYPVYEKIRFISEDTYKTWFRSHPIPGDIIFVNKGTPGRVCLCPDIIDFCIAQDMMAFRVDSNKLYNEYLLAVLRSRVMQEQIRITSVGDTIPHFKKEFLKDLYIPVPPMEIQRIIGDYYYNLSQKIELNKKINENLEQQAQAIFKSWFVDFEPFGGVMPDDWMVTTFDSICDFKNGYAFKSKELLNNPDGECYEVFKQGHILKGGGFNAFGTKSWFPKNKCEKLAKFVLKRNDILMAMTDMKGNVAILGNTAILPEDNRYILNQRVGLLRPKTQTGISPAYIYLLTNSNDFLFDLRSRANSGVQVNLSADAIRNSEVVLASKDICRKFSEIVDPLIEKTLDNQIENQRLTALRDALLPKLMNGEIDVSQVQI